jgi:hypothetical protein
MAQDVLKLVPEAVRVAENGYYDVDYSLIGAEFMTYEKWLSKKGVLQ